MVYASCRRDQINRDWYSIYCQAWVGRWGNLGVMHFFFCRSLLQSRNVLIEGAGIDFYPYFYLFTTASFDFVVLVPILTIYYYLKFSIRKLEGEKLSSSLFLDCNRVRAKKKLLELQDCVNNLPSYPLTSLLILLYENLTEIWPNNFLYPLLYKSIHPLSPY